MPEIYQMFSGMLDASQAMNTTSSEQLASGQDEVRGVQLTTEVDWTDNVGVDLLAVTQEEYRQTEAAATHQAAQARGYNQCASDGAGTVTQCQGIALSL